ncbi:MAG: sensor histidine kinase [Pirellula sp.]
MKRAYLRRIWLWIAFAALWSLAFAAVLWLGRSVVRLDQAEREARRAAAIEEGLRLSLWRLDTLLTPLIAQEALSTIPLSDDNKQNLSEDNKAYLSEEIQNRLSDNKLPAGPQPDTADQLAETEAVLSAIPHLGSFRWKLPASEPVQLVGEWVDPTIVLNKMQEFSRFRSNLPADSSTIVADATAKLEGFSNQQNRILAANEFSQRVQNYDRGNRLLMGNNALIPPADVPQPFTPIWHQGNLMLVRQNITKTEFEGWVVDWVALRRAMNRAVQDLLPECDFRPIENVAAQSSPDMLVSIPCIMIPGTVAGEFQAPTTDRGLSVSLVLIIGWIGILTTAVLTGLLLAGVLRLSERREAFVAAVTHELRTPLTTLQLYTEMLNSGMIRDEATRQSYLATLQNEVERIGHLVENVFAFARLEGGRSSRSAEVASLRSMLDRIQPRLDSLAKRFNMHLLVTESDAWDSCVAVDPSILEQILVNLVDNASKYACNGDERAIEMQAVTQDRMVHIAVLDHGPGFAPRAKWRNPFSKSVEQAAETVHGIGLGLAISHRFAKQLGGKLMIENRAPRGATVTLTIPLAEPL